MLRNCVVALLLWAEPIAAGAAFSLFPPSDSSRRSVRRSTVAMTSSSTALAAVDGGDKISVAVIGGGVAGLSCARALSDPSSPFEPTVFDTGRLRPGGRCSSRLPGDLPKNSPKKASRGTILGNVVIDHAAQILTVPNGEGFSKFSEQVKTWEEEEVIRPFPHGSVCEIMHDKKAEEKGVTSKGSGKPFYLRGLNSSKNDRMYYGVNGMQSIPAALAAPREGAAFEIQQDVWVSPNNGVRYMGGPFDPRWKVTCNGRTLGTYDRLVIAHNGKCADRLMSRTPAKALHSLLRTNFSPTVPQWGGKRMTLNSIYSFTFAVKCDGGDGDGDGDGDGGPSPLAEALGEDVVTAFVRNHPNLRLLTCQSRKHGRGRAANGKVEVWTVLSSPKFAKKFKAPQENIPTETAETVADLLLTSLEESLDLPSGAIGGREGLLDSKLQLWGAAVPLNVWESSASLSTPSSGGEGAPSGFLYDPENGVGAAGDWLLDPSIGGAWESGRRLAEWMIFAEKESNENGDGDVSVGLPPDGAFRISKAASQAGIGNVR